MLRKFLWERSAQARCFMCWFKGPAVNFLFFFLPSVFFFVFDAFRLSELFGQFLSARWSNLCSWFYPAAATLERSLISLVDLFAFFVVQFTVPKSGTFFVLIAWSHVGSLQTVWLKYDRDHFTIMLNNFIINVYLKDLLEGRNSACKISS